MTTHTIDEGFDPATGIRTRVHFEDGSIVYQKTFDAEPYLNYAKAARESTEGQRWGDGKIIGTIPPAIYARVIQASDREERERIVTDFFREQTAFVMFDKALK